MKTFDKLMKLNKQTELGLPRFFLSPVTTEFSPEANLLLQLPDLRLSLSQCCQAAGLGSGQIFPDIRHSECIANPNQGERLQKHCENS